MTGALNTYLKLKQEQMYRKRQHMFRVRYTVFPLVLRFSGLPNERDIDTFSSRNLRTFGLTLMTRVV